MPRLVRTSTGRVRTVLGRRVMAAAHVLHYGVGIPVRRVPVVLRALTDDQLSTAESIFDEFRDKDLKPAFLADADRALLDRRVICDLLGFDENVYEAVRRLSAKWCAEPSVHGGKKS